MDSFVTQKDNLLFADLAREGRTDYRPIPRLARVIPFGYEVDPENDNMLLPIVFELEALVKAKKLLKNYSYRDVARWVTEVTGRYISHMGLKKRLEIEKTRKHKTSVLKNWAGRYKKIMEEYEYYAQTLGAKD